MSDISRKPWIDLKRLREERGWIQQEAAKKMGVAREYVSAIENGRRGVSMRMMEAIIEVFGVKYEDFHKKP